MCVPVGYLRGGAPGVLLGSGGPADKGVEMRSEEVSLSLSLSLSLSVFLSNLVHSLAPLYFSVSGSFLFSSAPLFPLSICLF